MQQNFLHDIINADVMAGHVRVTTRFPPEPNGYLHIGHAKSICLNFGLAEEYRGSCNLRMDDTNPTKESTEYVEAIKRDVQWLGFNWGRMTYASDDFAAMHTLAVGLIWRGEAYTCTCPRETMRELRGTISEPGRPCACRDRAHADSLHMFKLMNLGKYPEGTAVLRAKIDLASPNMLMRDPVLYRVMHAAHHRTGDTWHTYPMYDYAHPISDALEGISHSVCTLEFENNRELYDWVTAHACREFTRVPKQYEYARLNLEHTVLSKRKLQQLVSEGHVDGWADPRMPTLAGLRNRGVTPAAIRRFIDMIGVAKTNSTVDVAKLDYCIREDLNDKAPRMMAVLDPLPVYIEDAEPRTLDAPLWPHDIPKEGTRPLRFTHQVYIERSDFAEAPPKGWHRLAPGGTVRLRHAGCITCTEVTKDAAGNVLELRCRMAPEAKPKGTIHWVEHHTLQPATVHCYEALFTHPTPERTGDWLSHLNPNSRTTHAALCEPALLDTPIGTHVQLERLGYFYRGEDGAFHRTATLRDSFTKHLSTAAPKEGP